MIPNRTGNRLKFLSFTLLIGTSLLGITMILFPFFYPIGYLVFIWLPIVLVLSLFITVSVLTLKNLKRVKPESIQVAFVLMLVTLGFHSLYLNEGPLEWLGLLIILTVVGIGIKVRSPLLKLEIMNWGGLGVLLFYAWAMFSWWF